MIIRHKKNSEDIRRPYISEDVKPSKEYKFESLSDLREVSMLVKQKYDEFLEDPFNLAHELTNMYSNITPRVAEFVIHDGTFKRCNHLVYVVEDTNYVLDPLGDRLSHWNPVRLKHNIVPWLYSLNMTGDFYLSQDHIPLEWVSGEEDPRDPLMDMDVLRLSGSPFYKGLRAIVL